MTGRLFAVGVGVASVVALAFGAIVPACYTAPQPVCGFRCGNSGTCPENYTCQMEQAKPGFGRCILNGESAATCDLFDAGPLDTFVQLDGMPDAELPDSFVQPDAPTDAEMIDAEMIDAPMVDAPMVDGPADASPDAAPMVDAGVDSAPADAPNDGVAADAAVD